MQKSHQPALLLGLIGGGIQASRAPAMHQGEAAAHNFRCIYKLIDLERLALGIDALPDLLTAAERMGFSGINITHPCKQAVIPLLSELSADAQAIGAVNTVQLRDRKRIGHNTDWWGFAENFRRGLADVPLRRVVQLGAGGAGAAVAYAMMKLGVQHLSILDVNTDRAHNLAASFGGRASAATDLAAALGTADGLINCTPIGMIGHAGMPLPANLLHADMWVAEVIYFPLETELLRTARALGCRTLDGGGMAVFQAAEAFHLFTGVQADTGRMLQRFAAMPGASA